MKMFNMLCLCLVLLINYAGCILWKDAGQISVHDERLSEGENLVYFTHGTPQFNIKNVEEVSQHLKVKTANVVCLSALVNGSISDQIATLAKNKISERKLIVIQDIESVSGNNMRNLDFIFRITDRTVNFVNIIVMLVHELSIVDAMETEISNQIFSFTAENWKDKLSEQFNSDSSYVNGKALTGRITLAAIQSLQDLKQELHTQQLENDTHTIHGMTIKSYCNSLSSASKSSPTAEEFGELRLDFMSFLALISIPMIMYFINKRASEQSKLQQQLNEAIAEQKKLKAERAASLLLHGTNDVVNPTLINKKGHLNVVTSAAVNKDSSSAAVIRKKSQKKGAKHTESSSDTDDALPVMIPADPITPSNCYRSGGETPAGFDPTLFREDYRSNLYSGSGGLTSVSRRRAHSSASTEGPFSAPRVKISNSNSRDSHDSAVQQSQNRHLRHAEGSDDEVEDESTSNDERRLSALKVARLSFGSQKSGGRQSLDGVILGPSTESKDRDTRGEDPQERAHSTGHTSIPVLIDINESILPVKRRGDRKSKQASSHVSAIDSNTSNGPFSAPQARQTRSTRTSRSHTAPLDDVSEVVETGHRTRAKTAGAKSANK